MQKSASDEDVFSAIGGLEISGKRETEGSGAVLATGGAGASMQGGAQAAGSAAPSSGPALPDSRAAGSLGGGGSIAASPGGSGFTSGPSIGDLPQDEAPSRTLFVRNLDPGTDVTGLQRSFEAYGEVRTLYTAALGNGFIMIAYYDLRAACLAMHSLQGTQLGNSILDIHFSAPREGSPEQHEGNVTLYNLDSSVSLEKLYQSFVTFGDVKDICSAPGRPNAKLIEFYDVRHATAAYHALSQGVASKRRTKSFDMAALPSVPEMNASAIPSHTSQESLAALTGGADSWGSNQASTAELAALASQAAVAALKASAPGDQQSLRALSSSSGEMAPGHIDQLGMAQLMAMQGSGVLNGGADAALAGTSYMPAAGNVPQVGSAGTLSDVGLSHFGPGSLPHGAGMGLQDSGRQLSAGLPQVRRLSASGSMEHLQRLGSAPLGVSGPGQSYGGRSSMPGSLPGSMGSGGVGGGMSRGRRLGSADGAHPVPQLPGGMPSAAAARLQSLGSAGSGSLPPGLGYDTDERSGGPVGASRSANDLAALYEAQQAQLAAQQAALLQQQRTLAALQSAASLAGSSQQMYNSPSTNSFSPGSSPNAPGWVQLQQQTQQSDAQLRQHAQVQAAFMQSAGLAGLSVGQLQALLAGQDGAAAGINGLPRSASTSAVPQQQQPQLNARLAAAIQAQGAAAQLAGRLGSKDTRRSDDVGSGNFGGGGRFARRGSESAAAERRSTQERLYSLDLDRVRAGDDARTTLMIKNIPNKYTQKMLLATIDEHFRGTYDFFYLPIDFKNKCNVGYAFINMLRPAFVVPLVERFNNRKWEKFNSEKVCTITYARIQGKNAMVAHFQNSSLLHEDKRCRPVLFHSEGPLAGEPEPFPVGPNSRLRPQRPPARDTHREHKLRERDAAW